MALLELAVFAHSDSCCFLFHPPCRYYKDSSWPEPEYIEGIVKDEDLFSTLYRELYFKHIYTKVEGGPTLDQRFDSYDNYIDLFNYVISTSTGVTLKPVVLFVFCRRASPSWTNCQPLVLLHHAFLVADSSTIRLVRAL